MPHSRRSLIYYPAPILIVSMLLASAWAMLAGMSTLLGWDYVELGYQTIKHGSGSLNTTGVAGTRIWDLPQFLLWLAAASWLTTVLLAIWQKLIGRPSGKSGTVLGLLVVCLLVLFAPQWMSLQLRHYNGPARVIRIDLGHRAFPLFSYQTNHDINIDYGDDAKLNDAIRYRCLQNQEWKFVGVIIEKSFYPTLDEKHKAQLLRQNCKRLGDSIGEVTVSITTPRTSPPMAHRVLPS